MYKTRMKIIHSKFKTLIASPLGREEEKWVRKVCKGNCSTIVRQITPGKAGEGSQIFKRVGIKKDPDLFAPMLSII